MSDRQASAKVEQCLFGYQDGHRLLAASINLPPDAASTLLLLSDLAPGVKIGKLGGYWTGIPLTAARVYALIRTWPAPEMPRPGCVWSHALLVRFAEVARFEDLGAVSLFASRPNTLGDYRDYQQTLAADPTVTRRGMPTSPLRSGRVDERDGLRLIRAAYSQRGASAVAAPAGSLDDALFALWSQQWPRLRRSFTFRTAGSALDEPTGFRFDLRLVDVPRHQIEGSSGAELAEAEPWEAAALADLVSEEPTAFRRFLWRYGSDIRRGRERFEFLAEFYVTTRVPVLAAEQLTAALDHVTRVLPSLDDGRLLKDDLVSGGKSSYALLPPSDALDLLEYFISHPDLEALPEPLPGALAKAEASWPSRADAVLALAERAAEHRSKLGELVLDRLADLADPRTFLGLSAGRPKIREHLIRRRPALLLSDELATIPGSELARLVELAPQDRAFAQQMVGYLVGLDDSSVASRVHTRFPEEAVRATLEALRRQIEWNAAEVAPAWLRTLFDNRITVLRSGAVENARTTRLLATLASVLQYDSREVLSAGPTIWADALRAARDDVAGRERQVFLAFLLAVALHSRASGSELLFERAFETVHGELWQSRFPRDATAILDRHLPDLGWWDQWDMCRRLRMGVVAAYVEGELDAASFKRLTHDRWLWDRLVDVADESGRGRRFIKKVSS